LKSLEEAEILDLGTGRHSWESDPLLENLFDGVCNSASSYPVAAFKDSYHNVISTITSSGQSEDVLNSKSSTPDLTVLEYSPSEFPVGRNPQPCLAASTPLPEAIYQCLDCPELSPFSKRHEYK
jgi:hypothetical protein